MDELRFDGRTAVVTGAGGGLGRSHAMLLAARGADVVVNDVRGEAAEAVAEEIRALGGSAVADATDLADPAAGASLVTGALDRFGRLDIVVHNAGLVRDRAFHNLASGDVDAVLAVHLQGGLHLLQAAWPRLREQRYGRVLTTTSGAGLFGNFGQANYAAAKMGLVGLTRVLALEGERYGIHANALAPLARTPMTEQVVGDLGEWLQPELVSPVAAWLVHEDCPANGEIFSAGGGRVAQVFIGVTRGHYDRNLTIEAVAEQLAAIKDRTGFLEPARFDEEIGFLRETIAATPAAMGDGAQ